MHASRSSSTTTSIFPKKLGISYIILIHVLMARLLITARPRLHRSCYLSYTPESPKGAVLRFKTSALRLSGHHLVVYPGDNGIP